MLFNYQVPVYFAVLLLSVTVWFLLHTRAGLILRAVGENHHAAGKWAIRCRGFASSRLFTAAHYAVLRGLIYLFFTRPCGRKT